MFFQKTIRQRVSVNGVGIHSGKSAVLHFIPAPPDSGVHFIRADLPGKPHLQVDARNVAATSYQTTLGGNEFTVATVEHCLSALSALRIDNLFIELEGPEIPIMDGSAGPFLEAILSVGLIEQEQPRSYCYITEPLHMVQGDKKASILPYQGLRISVEIDFQHPSIGRQSIDLDVNEQSFQREIASARTFGFLEDVNKMQAAGLAQGGSLENAIVLDKDSIMNPEGLRWSNEFVRHKALDALGDLVTLGMPLMGQVVLYKAGHDLMNRLIRALLDAPAHYRRLEWGTPLSDSDHWKHTMN